MAPRTRRQHDTVEVAPVAPSADTSMHTVSSKKKKKKKGIDTHQPTLPQLVLKGPQPKVAVAESEVSLGKHALPPEEGPTSNAEKRRATTGSATEPKPAKRAKAGDTQAHPPHLELSDDEEALSRLGNVPPNRVRKLKRTETLLVEDDSDDDISSGSDSKVSESESIEDEECDDLVGFTQTAKMSKMAFEILFYVIFIYPVYFGTERTSCKPARCLDILLLTVSIPAIARFRGSGGEVLFPNVFSIKVSYFRIVAPQYLL
ncbi:hypothetical protein EDB83DRAFT_2674251 [Lactarius deliciosus]|nr:hypothetical protein EDB83DRAFT_2674251 [Lactarius deliciosus]